SLVSIFNVLEYGAYAPTGDWAFRIELIRSLYGSHGSEFIFFLSDKSPKYHFSGYRRRINGEQFNITTTAHMVGQYLGYHRVPPIDFNPAIRIIKSKICSEDPTDFLYGK
nr:hypothetical protein [Chloroflexota bacterium]